MTTLSMRQVVALAESAGLDPGSARVAAAIAKAESGLRTDALGDTTITTATWGPSVGLWQVRSLKAERGTGGTRDATRLTNASFNARSMATISNHGRNFAPWSTYKNGAYKKHLTEALNAGSTPSPSAGGNPTPQPSPGGGLAGIRNDGSNSTSGGGVSTVDFDLPGPDILYGPGGMLGEHLLNKAGEAAGDLAGDLRAAVLLGLVWTAALGLGVSLVLIGTWRLTKETVS